MFAVGFRQKGGFEGIETLLPPMPKPSCKITTPPTPAVGIRNWTLRPAAVRLRPPSLTCFTRQTFVMSKERSKL
jgi:hypothetical protein